jgi:glycine betaine/proline transport system permease protein
LFSLQQLQVGKAVEQGIAITLIAVVLDQMTQAFMKRQVSHENVGLPWHQKHWRFAWFFGGALVFIILASIVPALAIYPKTMMLSYGAPINDFVRWISKNLFPYVKPIRDTITIWMLLPMRDFYLWLPWTTVIGGLGLVGWYLGGWRLALIPICFLSFMLLTGFWVPLMLTVYLVTGCTILCILIGVPIGIWCSRNPRVAKVVSGICDLLQTFPSFIYLIPVIMLFQTSDLSNVIAMLFYATVQRVPQTVIEAAVAAGATPRQKLWKVELPIALPEILLGINQTIMMALAMVAITALIGSRDLGQEIYKALPGADTGRGLLAGLGIAFIGIIASRLIGGWAAKMKQQLGMVE